MCVCVVVCVSVRVCVVVSSVEKILCTANISGYQGYSRVIGVIKVILLLIF
jgi:hypothetical protein